LSVTNNDIFFSTRHSCHIMSKYVHSELGVLNLSPNIILYEDTKWVIRSRNSKDDKTMQWPKEKGHKETQWSTKY
jgi:hypothetical protein